MHSVTSTTVIGNVPFEQEVCDRHNVPVFADLVFTSLCGTYRWRCPLCGLGWVTEGSPMDIANEIAFANCRHADDQLGEKDD